GSHPYGDEGGRTVTVTVKDVGGSTVTASQAITVADAQLTAGGTVTRRGVEGRPLTGAVGTFRDGFTGATAADYTGATITWGDRSTAAGAVVTSRGGFAVTGSHTYATAGLKHVIVSIRDRGRARATARTQLTVS